MGSKTRTSCHRRNHHTTMKNQKTRMRNMMYQSQRQPCRSAILFIRLNVPESMPEVSAKASFCMEELVNIPFTTNTRTRAHHVTELHGGIPHLTPYCSCDLESAHHLFS